MLNATLFGQMITFAIFAWVTMKFILPQVNAALEARENEKLVKRAYKRKSRKDA